MSTWGSMTGKNLQIRGYNDEAFPSNGKSTAGHRSKVGSEMAAKYLIQDTCFKS